MKQILLDSSEVFGLVAPGAGESVVEIAKVGTAYLEKALGLCDRLSGESGSLRTLRLGYLESNDGTKFLMIRPGEMTGIAWVCVAPMSEEVR